MRVAQRTSEKRNKDNKVMEKYNVTGLLTSVHRMKPNGPTSSMTSLGSWARREEKSWKQDG
jgi:hypothetical protein